MNNKFITLTKNDNTSIIIGVNNIATIEVNDNDNNEKSKIVLNFSYGKDQTVRIVRVQETFDEINNLLNK